MFDACVVSKLAYGLHTACLNQTERRRLDGFQSKCLQKILRISHSYYSRISNKTVLLQVGHRPISCQIQQQQALFMGNLARRADDDPVRKMVFEPGGINLKALPGPRRVGRPRLTWAPMVHDICLQMAGTHERLKTFFEKSTPSANRWRETVMAYAT